MKKTSEYIMIDGVLYRKVDSFSDTKCPFCGSSNLITIPSNETFLSRIGCLSCDKWLEPVRLRND